MSREDNEVKSDGPGETFAHGRNAYLGGLARRPPLKVSWSVPWLEGWDQAQRDWYNGRGPAPANIIEETSG